MTAELVKLFHEGASHNVLAEKYGVSRRTIQVRLKAAGVDPSLNVKKRRAAKLKQAHRKVNRDLRVNGERKLAMKQLRALAKKHNVQPLTLAHFTERTGHYRPGVTVNLRHGRPRRLPRRRSHEGAVIAASVERACAPWTPRHIAGLLRGLDS